MKVFVTGTRGVPGIPGGVERHCEQLYPLLARQGISVRISRRSAYTADFLSSWNDLQLVDIVSPRLKSLEAIVHTMLSVMAAKFWKADIIHIHAIGPALLVPLARMLGMKVIVTNHGPDYERQKWGNLAKNILKLGEYLGCGLANEVIVISNPIREIVRRRCKRDSHLVYNGVPLPELQDEYDYLDTLGLVRGKYLLVTARLVPEKGIHDLIEVFETGNFDCSLVIAGDSDFADAYSIGLRKRVKGNSRIVMPGYVTGSKLAQLYSHARLFVLPSYHEGLPIALLEALSYGLPVVVSDIPANVEVQLEEACYYPVGDVVALRELISTALKNPVSDEQRSARRSWVRENYNWEDIAGKTIQVYKKAIK